MKVWCRQNVLGGKLAWNIRPWQSVFLFVDVQYYWMDTGGQTQGVKGVKGTTNKKSHKATSTIFLFFLNTYRTEHLNWTNIPRMRMTNVGHSSHLTSHHRPHRADQVHELHFDAWFITKTSNTLVHSPADWRGFIHRQIYTQRPSLFWFLNTSAPLQSSQKAQFEYNLLLLLQRLIVTQKYYC